MNGDCRVNSYDSYDQCAYMFDESLSNQQTNSLEYETQIVGIGYGCLYTRKSYIYSSYIMTVELCHYYCNKFGFTYAALYG